MTEPAPDHYLQLRWVEPAWLAEATGWIRAQLDRRGIGLAGAIEQPHVRWWSTVLRVPTSEGDLYFKATAPAHAFEAALTEVLHGLFPGRVPQLLAVDRRRGWLLMRDGGVRLREVVRSVADLGRWEELLPLYGELQLGLAPQAGELLALGVPDERLAGLPARLRRLLEDRESLLIGVPEGLTAEEHRRLLDACPGFAESCSALAAYGIPETIQHDDFHDGNVCVGDGRYVFFDWGDSCVSHPFHTLVVTLRSIAWRLELEPGGPELLRLRDAYLEPFARFGRREELAGAAELAYRVGTVGRALAWHRFVSAMDTPFREENVDAVPYGLKRFLAGGPLGAWR